MRVSLVIPAHDAAPFLAQTLRSALNQTRPADEILVVDDGSTDDTATIARSFAPEVRVTSVAFANGAAARRAGYAEVSGDAIMFLDADDLLDPSVIEGLAATLAAHPDAIARCRWKRYERTGPCWVAARPTHAPRPHGRDDLGAWLMGWWHPPCALMWSRAAYEASGGWDPSVRVNQDGDLAMRAFLAGACLVPAPTGTAYYRRTPVAGGSVSARRFTADGLRSRLEVLDRVADRLAAAGRLAHEREPLAHAYREVAADAGAHPDAEARALAAAAAHGANATRRRGGRRRPRPSGPPAPPRQPAVPLAHPVADAPLVSVIVPTYERSALLRRAVASVLSQTYDRFEVLVIDDGSTEDIAAVVDGFGDDRVRCLRQPENRGVAAARNRGLAAAAGEAIAFLDSDDAWHADKLAAQVDLLRRSSDRVGLIYTGVVADDGAGGRLVIEPRRRGDVFSDMLHHNVIKFGTSSVLVRREAVTVVGGFDEAFPAAEDHDYFTRIARFYDVDFVAEPLVTYANAAPVGAKRSRDFEANRRAREMFAWRYAWEAAEAGVLHRFLLESARRELEHPDGSNRRALMLLAKAVRWRPSEPRLYLWFGFALLPRALRGSVWSPLKALRARVPQRLWFGHDSA